MFDIFMLCFFSFFMTNMNFEIHFFPCPRCLSCYPAELQLNKAKTSDRETSFLDLNIKVIGSNIQNSAYDKHDDFGFPIFNFPWLSGDLLILPYADTVLMIDR